MWLPKERVYLIVHGPSYSFCRVCMVTSSYINQLPVTSIQNFKEWIYTSRMFVSFPCLKKSVISITFLCIQETKKIHVTHFIIFALLQWSRTERKESLRCTYIQIHWSPKSLSLRAEDFSLRIMSFWYFWSMWAMPCNYFSHHHYFIFNRFNVCPDF